MRTSDHGWRQAATARSHRLVAPIIFLTLLTVGTMIYLLPSGDSGSAAAERARTRATPSDGPTGAGPTMSAEASPTATVSAIGSSAPGARTVDVVNRTTILRPDGTTATVTRTAGGNSPGPQTTTTRTRTRTRTVTRDTKLKHCWNFTWQQDAQAAYLDNLSDPGGLDGAPGPANGDGLACTQLPKDPTRPASTPVDAYQAPVATAAVKSQLVSPATDYYGVTQDKLPGSTKDLNTFDATVGKAPSSIGFFGYWDSGYPATKVTAAWQRDALPVMTWMSKSSTSDSDTSYSITHILDGDWDNYLYNYAGQIVRTGLPVVIRFDHEMNGAWYPWSAGQTSYNNTPAKYVAMWRHVWNIFEQVGANDDVIWLYSPARVDNIEGHTGSSSIAADYPGDQYVDWVGATVYWRNSAEPTDYQTSFGKTISELRAVTSKPLFFAEIGALQSYHNVDVTAKKQQWIQNTLQGFLADPSVIGFNWFNNIATTPDDPDYAHDWRVNSSAATLATFTDQVTSARFAGGTMPDSTKTGS